MLQKAYGESAMKKTTSIYEWWYRRFQDGREDDERSGRPSQYSMKM
jgi:hypothetical protein